MEEIVGSVKRVTDIMGEITAASQEQTTGIEQINQAIAQMDQTTQQNASLVEEAAAAAQSMQEQADSLARAVSVFKLHARAGDAPAYTRVTPLKPQAAPARAKPARKLAQKAREKLLPNAGEKPRGGADTAGPSPKLAMAGASAPGDWTEF
jgi:methyl-accepting chemotaxis protein